MPKTKFTIQTQLVRIILHPQTQVDTREFDRIRTQSKWHEDSEFLTYIIEIPTKHFVDKEFVTLVEYLDEWEILIMFLR